MNNYIYVAEENASKLFNLPPENYELNILCYSINEDIMEPFLLFMVEKNNNFLNFPKLLLNSNEDFDIENNLERIIPTEFIYKGVISDKNNNYYILVNVEKTFSNCQNYFALVTEIINYKKIYNYSFAREITNLFINNPSFYLLINKTTKYSYKLPDVVHKYINPDETNYYLNFGNKKEKFYESCDEYFFFNRAINNLRHVTIVRYALFSGNKIYFEDDDEFMLNDYEINELLKNDKYKTITISYSTQNHNFPDMLVVNYNNFIALSINDICE
jgi:hypothetical protein